MTAPDAGTTDVMVGALGLTWGFVIAEAPSQATPVAAVDVVRVAPVDTGVNTARVQTPAPLVDAMPRLPVVASVARET